MIVRAATTADAEAIARVHVESWRVTYRGIVSAEYLAALDIEIHTAKWRDRVTNATAERRIILVSTDAHDTVLGFAIAGPPRKETLGFDAELYAIYLAPGAERRGLGRALFFETVVGLRCEKFTSLAVWVLKRNPAHRFYESLGAERVGESKIEIGGEEHEELAYAWKSFDQLRRTRGRLELARYLDQSPSWPTDGRHVLAQFDDDSIIVYQAYRPEIADFAVAHQKFGGPFSFSRMSWVKPNFLWMMYRSGWGTKEGQERVLAVRVRREFFERLASSAVASSWDPAAFPDREAWQSAAKASDVRLQWDPDHNPSGAPVARRAIQLGIRGKMLREYATDAVIEILDVSALVERERWNAVKPYLDLQTPCERVFPLAR